MEDAAVYWEKWKEVGCSVCRARDQERLKDSPARKIVVMR